MDNNAPRDVLRDGALKASIWRNEGEKGPFYSASLSRTYRDQNGEPRETHSFAGNELLRVSELARKAYDRTQDLRRDDRVTPDREQRREAFRESRQPGEQHQRQQKQRDLDI